MAYTLTYPWSKNPRLIDLAWYDVVTGEDLTQALTQVESLFGQSAVPMHVIFNFIEISTLPEDMLDLMRKHPVFAHPNCGYCIFLQSSEFVSFVAKIVNHETGATVEFALDYEQVWEFFSQLGIC